MTQTRPRKPSKKPDWQKQTVRERIAILFSQARESSGDHPERSRRYVEMARKLSMRYNLRLTPEQKKLFCPSCSAYLVPGKNLSTRTSPSQKAVIRKCGECGHSTRHPYRRERSGKK